MRGGCRPFPAWRSFSRCSSSTRPVAGCAWHCRADVPLPSRQRRGCRAVRPTNIRRKDHDLGVCVETEYPITERLNVLIPFPDGATLAANLITPDGAGPVPAIIVYQPYL